MRKYYKYYKFFAMRLIFKNDKFLYINLFIIIIFIASLSTFYFILEKEKNSILLSAQNTSIKVENLINHAINSIYYLETTINEIYKNRKNLSLTEVDKIKEINTKGDYALDNPNSINLTGYGGLSGDENIRYEMAMALSLTQYFKTVATHNKDFAWIYYISKNRFSTLYPFTFSKDFIFNLKNQNFPIYTQSTPKNNPYGKLFFTPIYPDGVGKGLMTTMGIPIYDKNNFLGTVDIDITLSSQSKILKNMNLFGGSYLIVNAQNEIIGADGVKNFNTQKIFNINDFMDKEMISDTKQNRLIVSGFNYIFMKKLKNTPWKLYYHISVFDIIVSPLLNIISLLFIILLLFKFKKEIKKYDSMEDLLQEKGQQIIQQSRLTQMGEMLSMIAHQWRQPLNIISVKSANLIIKAHLNKVTPELVISEAEGIDEHSQKLSITIDDFRNFFNFNKEAEVINFCTLVDTVLSIIEASTISKNINIIREFNCKEKFNTYPNEVKHVILNLIQNAEDILLEKHIKNPFIKISTYKKDDNYICEINDNGGGIPFDSLNNIFDPYFSTKKQKDGTGLGLYMSKTIIEEHCGGKLTAENNKDGAVFKIILS